MKKSPLLVVVAIIVAFTAALTTTFTPLVSAGEESPPSQVTEAKNRSLLDIVSKMATVKAAEMLSEGVIEKIVQASIQEVKNYPDPGFKGGYRSARAVILDDLYTDRYYEHIRALVVTKVKNHLHNDGSLVKYYQDNRLKVAEVFKGLTPDERSRLALKLLAAQQTFFKIKDPAGVKLFTELDKVRKKYNNELMRQNLSDEGMSEAILAGELVTYHDFDDFRDGALSSFQDQDLAEFAWRRWCEGGEKLVDQYLQIISMATEDLLLAK